MATQNQVRSKEMRRWTDKEIETLKRGEPCEGRTALSCRSKLKRALIRERSPYSPEALGSTAYKLLNPLKWKLDKQLFGRRADKLKD